MVGHKQVRTILVLVFCLGLSACDRRPAEQQMLAEYRERLARVLDVADIAPDAPKFISFPSRRELTLPQHAMQLDILEFLRLSPCQLQRLIGERNSSLGQVMSHSQQWLYEAKFIVAARDCLQQLLPNPKYVNLQSKLQRVLDEKLQERYAVTWNATFASKEFQTLFSPSIQYISAGQEQPGELMEALTQLRWLLDRWHSADIVPDKRLEAQYQVIGAADYMGQLQQSLALAVVELRALNHIQQSKLSGRPLCFNERSNRAGDALNGVFFKFYIGEVQPYLAKLYQHGDSVIPLLEQIKYATKVDGEVLPSTFRYYWRQTWDVTNDHSLWQSFTVLLREHTLNWQAQLKQCGLMPTG